LTPAEGGLRTCLPVTRVKNEIQFRCGIALPSSWGRPFARTALVLLLLVSVVGLSTLAKDGQYFPTTTSARHVSLSTKMNVAHAPTLPSADKLRAVARIAPPPPAVRVTHLEQFETAPVQRISLTVSMQHRSPPAYLA
jgi:hypothetical protein